MKSLARALHLEQLEARILLDGFVDLFEPNDDFAGAADLGPVVGAELVGGLTLHNDMDVDFFAFTTVAAATESHYVLMDVPAGAEPSLELYDAGESLLAWGTYVDGDLTVSLAELPAGTYYIRADGWIDPLQSYQLQIFAPGGAEGDIYEPNDSFGEATTLAEVSAEQLWADLTIHSDTDVDYFQFTLLAEGAVSHYAQIQFTHADGDLDLALYDVAEDYLTSSKTITDNELISLEGMAAGTYYLRVYGYEGATNDYDLLIIAPTAADVDSYEPNDSFVAATDFGQQNGPLQIYDLTIHGGDEDYFTFTTQADFTASSYAEIRFGHAEGDLDLELFDSGENLVLSSTTATDNETIWLSGLSPGKYYIHVTGYNGATNGYELRLVVPRYDLEADAYESNESFGTARDLGQVTGTNEWTDLTIHSEDDEDWFKFTTLGTGTGSHSVQLRFSHADGNIEISVYDSEQRLKGWGTTPTDDEWVSLAGQPAGTYYIAVYGRWTAVNAYDLVISAPLEEWPADAYEANNSFGTASDLGEVGAWTEIEELTVHSNTDVDYFRFTTRGPGTEANHIEVAFTHADGDLDLALYGGAMNFLAGSTSVTDDERVSLDGLSAGTYYAKVSGYAGATNEYELRMAGPLLVWDADPYEPNDELAAATDLRGASGTQRWNDLTIHDTEDEDYFQFTTYDLATWTHSVTIEFSHAEGNLTLRLYDQDGYSLRTGSGHTDNESVTLGNLPPGTYYVSVDGGGYATNGYDLVIVAPAQVLADPYESNDDFVTATNLREINGTQELTGLSIHSQTDEDYFLFSTTGTQTTSHYVEISLNNDDGDLDLVIYDASWAPVAWSTTTGDVERVSLGGLPADTYYAHVVGYEDGINNYDLVICAPAAAIPPDGWEDSEPVPIRSNGTIEGLTIHDPADWEDYGDATDRFEFTMATAGGPAHHVSINFAHADGDLDMRLWNSSWSIVGTSASVTNDEFISLYGLPADTYTAEIYSYDGKETAYDFSINAPFSSTGPPAAWTFLYYFGGDDISGGGSWSLETYAWEDVNEMERVNLPWDLQVGILMDRIEGYVTTDPDWTDTRVGILRHDSNTWTVSTEFDQWEPEERNIGLAYTLESFINWASVALPAQHYGLFLMDHGFGYRGVCWDETSADDQLTLAEIQQALAGAAVDIDVIGFDACLMGIADVAYALQDYVDVVVGSEEVEWTPGWDNQRLLNALAADSYLTPEDVGSYIVQAYASYWGNEDMGTLSAIDCSVDWADSVANFVDAVLTYATPADWQLMAWARSATPTFRHAYFYDLRTFMSLIWVTPANSAIRNAAWGAVVALNSAVIENYSAEGEGGTGLSVYIPPVGEEVDPFYRYQDFAQDTGWVDFLDAFVAAGAVPGPTPDWAESNHVFALAYDLHSLHGEGWFFPNLSIHGTYNDDWFRLTTLSEGTSDHQVLIDFDNSEGNIDLHLYDSAGYLLRTSEGDTDFEMVTLNLLAADTYYIRVFGRGAAVNPDYTLHVDAPPSVVEGFDWPVGNINIAKATQIQGDGIFYAGLFAGEGEEDWFGLDGSMLGWQTTLTIQAIYDPVAYDLTLTMCDPDGQPLATSVENADGCVVVLHGAESGSFYLQVTSGTPGVYVPYTLVVDESLDPYIELEDPAAGTLQRPGDTYTINWTDQHPDGDAVIALYWDSDSDPDNNDPVDEGVTWGTIATGISENDTANALDWTVNAPSGADYYLHAVIGAGASVNSDYTGTTLGVWECHLVASDVVDGVTVSVYDADPSNGISDPSVAFSRSDYVAGVTDVLVDAGRIGDGIIGAIILLGDGTDTADLGIVVEDNVGLGSLVDARTASRPIRFFVSEGYVGAVNLKDGIAGYDLNGFTTEGGWVLDPGSDIDGDGDNDDLTGVYVNGYLRSLVARGDVNGDVVVGDDLTSVQVLGGDLNGDAVSTNGSIGTVLARALYVGGWVGGNISGDISTEGSIGAVLAIGGDVTGSIEAASGYIGRVLAQRVSDGGSVSGDISAGGYVGSVLAIRGNGIDAGIEAGTWIGPVRSIGGDIDLRGHQIAAGTNIALVQAVDGSILGSGGPLAPDISIVNGNLGSMQAIRGDIDGVSVDVGGSPPVTGRIGSVVANGGGIVGSSIEADGQIGVVYALGGDVDASIVSNSGLIGRVIARQIGSVGGNVSGQVNASGYIGAVYALGALGGPDMTADTTSGTGIGRVYSAGDLSGDISVTGNLGAVTVRGNITGSTIDVASGTFSSLWAGGSVSNTSIGVDGRFASMYAAGDFYNSSIQAGTLSRVLIAGEITEDAGDGDWDRIRALSGAFFARDRTWGGWIDDGASFGDHWFDEADPDGVRVWVG